MFTQYSGVIPMAEFVEKLTCGINCYRYKPLMNHTIDSVLVLLY